MALVAGTLATHGGSERRRLRAVRRIRHPIGGHLGDTWRPKRGNNALLTRDLQNEKTPG